MEQEKLTSITQYLILSSCKKYVFRDHDNGTTVISVFHKERYKDYCMLTDIGVVYNRYKTFKDAMNNNPQFKHRLFFHEDAVIQTPSILEPIIASFKTEITMSYLNEADYQKMNLFNSIMDKFKAKTVLTSSIHQLSEINNILSESQLQCK